MDATVKIDLSTPQAVSLLGYLETLPFAKVERPQQETKSTWQQAIDEGAVTVEEFVHEAKRQIKEHFKNA